MDMMIVDRDETERMGIEWFIKSSQLPFHTIYHAGSVQQANNILLKHQPAIVMIELEMLTKNNTKRFTKNVNQFCKSLIAVTAEPVFERALQAMELNTSYLLVKPLHLDELKKALTQASSVKKVEAGDEDYVSEEQDIYNAIYLNTPLTTDGTAYFLLMEPENPAMNPALYEWLVNLKLPFPIQFYPLNEMVACIATPDSSFDMESVRGEAYKLLYLWEEEYKENINIALYHTRMEGGSKLQDVFSLSKKALQMKFYKGFKQLFLTNAIPEFQSFNPFLTTSEQRTWIECLEREDIETIKKLLYKILEEPKGAYPIPEIVRIQITSILAQIRRFMDNYHLANYPEIEEKYHRLFHIILNSPILYTIVQEFILFSVKIINYSVRQKENRTNSYFEISRLYLENNFRERHLSLNDVADYLNISANYLSNILSENGTSFSTLLNELRIKEAKKLLLNTKEPIQTISEKVGFKDANYFSRVFKNRTGVSPRKFRSIRT